MKELDPVFTDVEALELLSRLRHAGMTVVFTDGIFDLLHSGHLRCLQHARRLDGALLVGINSDRSARAHNGPDRPMIPERSTPKPATLP